MTRFLFNLGFKNAALRLAVWRYCRAVIRTSEGYRLMAHAALDARIATSRFASSLRGVKCL
jgi:hypothetical protein